MFDFSYDNSIGTATAFGIPDNQNNFMANDPTTPNSAPPPSTTGFWGDLTTFVQNTLPTITKTLQQAGVTPAAKTQQQIQLTTAQNKNVWMLGAAIIIGIVLLLAIFK